MKEATGELSMTVITIVAIVAIAGIITWLAPLVEQYVSNQWENIENPVNNDTERPKPTP